MYIRTQGFIEMSDKGLGSHAAQEAVKSFAVNGKTQH